MKKLLLPVAAAAVAALVFLGISTCVVSCDGQTCLWQLAGAFRTDAGDKSFAARGAGFALEFGARVRACSSHEPAHLPR